MRAISLRGARVVAVGRQHHPSPLILRSQHPYRQSRNSWAATAASHAGPCPLARPARGGRPTGWHRAIGAGPCTPTKSTCADGGQLRSAQRRPTATQATSGGT